MTWRALAVLVVLAGGCGKPARVAPAPTDLDGTYDVVERTLAGYDNNRKDETLVIRNGSITPRRKGRDEETATFTLDPIQSPPHIDIRSPDGEVIQGVYRVRDTDQGRELTLAFQNQGSGPRPADFNPQVERRVVVRMVRKPGG